MITILLNKLSGLVLLVFLVAGSVAYATSPYCYVDAGTVTCISSGTCVGNCVSGNCPLPVGSYPYYLGDYTTGSCDVHQVCPAGGGNHLKYDYPHTTNCVVSGERRLTFNCDTFSYTTIPIQISRECEDDVLDPANPCGGWCGGAMCSTFDVPVSVDQLLCWERSEPLTSVTCAMASTSTTIEDLLRKLPMDFAILNEQTEGCIAFTS